MFHRSFCAIGLMTSLNSGLASRETCRNGPRADGRAGAGSRIRLEYRLAEAYTPMTEVGRPRRSAVTPPRVRSVFGTWIAIVCTFRPAQAVDAGRGRQRDQVRELNGRSPPRSKTLPRSTKNGSARWPAKTCRPPPSWCTAAAVNVAA